MSPFAPAALSLSPLVTLFVFGAALFIVPALHATDGTWTANNNNGPWSTTNNWAGGIVASGIDGTATFSQGLTLSKYMYLDANRTIGNITYSSASGFSWEIRPNSTPSKTLTLQVTSGAPTINVTATHANGLIISAKIAGTQGFSKIGNGTLTLSGTNTYTGATAINAGKLNLTGSLTGGTAISTSGTGFLSESAAGVISGAASFTQGSSGTSILAGSNSYTGATAISAGKLDLTGSLTGGTAISTSGTGFLSESAAGVISGAASFTQGSSGTSILAGSNTYTGATTVNAGTLALGANSTLGTDNHVVLAGGTLDMGGFTNIVGTLAVTGNATLALGDGTGSLSFANSTNVSWSGDLTLTGTLGATTLRFGTSSNALTAGQMARIMVNGVPVCLGANGYVVPPVITIQVETASDGSGTVVSAQTLQLGESITVYAITRDTNGAFIGNPKTSWTLINTSGLASGGDLVVATDGKSATFTGIRAGTAQIQAQGGSTTVPSGKITVDPPSGYTRPFIWVRASERAAINTMIQTQPWAKSIYDEYVSRSSAPMANYLANQDGYLRTLPINWAATPPVYQGISTRIFTEALECAVLYYITQDEKYARLAADVLHNSVKTIAPLPTDNSPGGGYIIPGNMEEESLQVGTQLPIIYDFLYSYLKSHQVYDLQTRTMVDFNFVDAQTVFRNCYKDGWLSGNYSNHNGFMCTRTFNNMLALDDPAERGAAVNGFITSMDKNALSIAKVNDIIRVADDIWPECFNYTGVINSLFNKYIVLLERIDPTLKLFENYPYIPGTIGRVAQFRYPNGELIQHGHTKRWRGGQTPTPELSYAHAKMKGYVEKAKFWGGLIQTEIQNGRYDRSDFDGIAANHGGAKMECLQLLLQAPVVDETPTTLPEPRTDDLVYAGITMQRNPAPTDNLNYGLMCFVGGGGYVHSHASGMNMELYGAGLVMGRKGVAELYDRESDEAKSFDRLFGGANTVVVNGASRGDGGHADLGINKVQNVDMEPRPFETALSPNHSFTVSSFFDDRGDMAEGTEQRMLTIVRTSPTTGYYVDIFRSKSVVANRTALTLDGVVTNQYHDYIYRNIGETNITVQTSGGALPLYPQPERFTDTSAYADGKKFPGYVYFLNPVVSHRTNVAFRTQFAATVSGVTRYMDMHMPAVAIREIAKVDCPRFSDAPAPYNNKSAPTLVVRQIGDAWNKPFATVYEPHFGSSGGTVQNVMAIEQSGVVVGLKIESIVFGTNVTQYVLSHPDANGVISYPAAGIQFSGRFAVVTDRGNGIGELYIGAGSSLAYGKRLVKSAAGNATQASVVFDGSGAPQITANQPVVVADAEAGLIVMADAISLIPYSTVLTSQMFPPPSSGSATSLTYMKVSGPSWLIVSPDGSISGTPANADLGLNEFTIRADNGVAPPVTATLRITVLPNTTPPTAASFLPADGAVGISVVNDLSVTFNEPVSFGTGAITLRRSSDDAVVESFDVAVPAAGLGLSGPTVTINPTADLDYLTGYYVQVDPAAIQDLAGNPFAGITNKTTWNFTTSIHTTLRTWTGASYLSTWSHGTNFDPSGTPSDESYLIVFHATGADRLDNYIQNDYTIGGLVFNTNADANVSIRLRNSNTNSSAPDLIMGGPNNRNPAITVEVGSAGNHTIGSNGTETASGNLILAGDLTVAHDGGGTLTINRPITETGGTRSLTKTGSGTLVLSAANTYTGPTTINEGRLKLGVGGSIASSDSIFIGAGATLDTTALANYVIPAGKPLVFALDTTGEATNGVLQAAGLNISNASVSFYATDIRNYEVFVLATYTGLTGARFASMDGIPADYVLDYAYEGNKIALVAYVPPEPPPPASLSFTPGNAATGVSLGANLTVTFDQSIFSGAGTISIVRSSDGVIVENFDVATSPRLTFSDFTLTIDPTADLSSDTAYHILIDDGAVVGDASDIPFAGIADSATWSFRTERVNVLPYQESFEAYAAGSVWLADGVFTQGNSNHWTGSAGTLATIVTNAYPWSLAYPLPGENHTKVLRVESGTVSNQLVSSDKSVLLDFMIQPTLDHGIVEAQPQTNTNQQFAAFFSTNGLLHIRTRDLAQGTNRWTQLTHAPLASNAWVRMRVRMLYDANGSGLTFFTIRLSDGTWLEHADGFADVNGTPAPSTPGGRWFAAPSSNAQHISSVTFGNSSGSFSLDDLSVNALDNGIFKDTPAVTWPTASEIAQGQTLQKVRLLGGAASNAAVAVSGEFRFVPALDTVVNSSAPYGVAFAPGSVNYFAVTGSVFVTALAWVDTTGTHTTPISFYANADLSPGDHGVATFEELDLLDSDGDGMPNWQEYVAGTNPKDSNSVLRVTGLTARPDTGTLTVKWIGGTRGPTLPYVVEAGTSLGGAPGAWIDMSNHNGRVEGPNTFSTSKTNSLLFIRIRAPE